MGFFSFIRRLTRKPTRREPPPQGNYVGVPTKVTYDGLRRAGLAGGPDALVEKQIREWIALTPEERARVPPDRRPLGVRHRETWDEDLRRWQDLPEKKREKVSPHVRPWGAFPRELEKMKELNMVWWNALSPEEQSEVPPHQRPEGAILKGRG